MNEKNNNTSAESRAPTDPEPPLGAGAPDAPGLPARLLATWFASGLMPKAPGTWGTLAALPFAWALHAFYPWPVLAAATAGVFLIGIWASDRYMAQTGESDPGAIVIDEVAGMWLTLLPAAYLMPFDPDAVVYALAFALFRIADIFKPWPVSWADRAIKGGFGVMLDDILAALYAAAALVLVMIAVERMAA